MTDEQSNQQKERNNRIVKPLRPFQWKKGVSGNPKGRPKGSKSLKEFAREYLLAMPEADKLAFLAALPPEIVFRMAEGNPHTTVDNSIEVVQPIPILSLNINKTLNTPNSNTELDKVKEGYAESSRLDPPTPLVE